MTFDRNLLPDAVSYFESQDLRLTSKGKWRTTQCKFHESSDSMRVNVSTGAWVCMSCGAKGGDVLAYEMQINGAEFVDAAKALGAWVNDGKPERQHKPTALSPRAALSALTFEANLVAIAAGNLAMGVILTDADRARLMVATGRINRVAGDFE
jgi:DNA primase